MHCGLILSLFKSTCPSERRVDLINGGFGEVPKLKRRVYQILRAKQEKEALG